MKVRVAAELEAAMRDLEERVKAIEGGGGGGGNGGRFDGRVMPLVGGDARADAV